MRTTSRIIAIAVTGLLGVGCSTDDSDPVSSVPIGTGGTATTATAATAAAIHARLRVLGTPNRSRSVINALAS